MRPGSTRPDSPILACILVTQKMTPTDPTKSSNAPVKKRKPRWLKRGLQAFKECHRRLQAGLTVAMLFSLRLVPRPVWIVTARALLVIVPAQFKKVAANQLDEALGTRYSRKEQRVILRSMYTNLARILREVAQYQRGKRSFLERMVHVSDDARHELRELLAEHGSLIMMSPHFGNFELLPAWCNQNRLPEGPVVARQLPNRHVNRILVAGRSRNGVETLYQDENPRKLLRALKNGTSIGLVPDLDIKRIPGIFVDFFGKQAYTASGPAHLSYLSGKPILPLFLLWQGEHYDLLVDDLIVPDQEGPKDEEIRRLTEAWSLAFERRIADHPDHWYWFHERWKTTPRKLEKRRRGHRLGRKT